MSEKTRKLASNEIVKICEKYHLSMAVLIVEPEPNGCGTYIYRYSDISRDRMKEMGECLIRHLSELGDVFNEEDNKDRRAK